MAASAWLNNAAPPLHVQSLEKALEVKPLIRYIDALIKDPNRDLYR